MVNSICRKNSGIAIASFQDASGNELLKGQIVIPYTKTGTYRIALETVGTTEKKVSTVACKVLQNPSSLGRLKKFYYSLLFVELTAVVGGKETQIFVNKNSLKKRLKNPNMVKTVQDLSQHKHALSQLSDWKIEDEGIELTSRPIETGKTRQNIEGDHEDRTITAQAERVYSLFFNEKVYVFKEGDQTFTSLAGKKLGQGGESVVYKDMLMNASSKSSETTTRRKPHHEGYSNKENARDADRHTRKLLSELREVPGIVQPSHTIAYSTRGTKKEHTERVVELVPYYNCGDLLSDRTKKLINTPQARIEAMSQALQALDNLHKKRVLHGDIKSENILLNDNNDGTFTLGLHDFGLASRISPRGAKTVAYSGTITFLPPEEFNLREGSIIYASPKRDIWAMGMTLYELIHRDQPDYVFSTRPLEEIEDFKGNFEHYEDRWKMQNSDLEKTLQAETDPLLKLDAQMDLLILKLLHHDPLQRPSAAQALQELQSIKSSI